MLVAVGAGEDVDWSREEESHDCWTGDRDCGCGCGGAGATAGVGALLCGFGEDSPLARACASHASRVLWSTGQAAAGSSCEDIVAVNYVYGEFRRTWDGDGNGSRNVELGPLIRTRDAI